MSLISTEGINLQNRDLNCEVLLSECLGIDQSLDTRASTTENKAENALLLNVVASWCDDVRNICGFSNAASHRRVCTGAKGRTGMRQNHSYRQIGSPYKGGLKHSLAEISMQLLT